MAILKEDHNPVLHYREDIKMSFEKGELTCLIHHYGRIHYYGRKIEMNEINNLLDNGHNIVSIAF